MLLVLLFLVLVDTKASFTPVKGQQEPVCSKFDFEEKVLEKMVRMEHNNALMMEEFKAIRDQVAVDLANLRIESVNMKISVKEELESQRNVSEKLKGSIEEEKEKLKEEVLDDMALLQAKTEKSSYAFSAYWLADTTLSAGQTLVFAKTIFDEEDSYDNTTGKCTAPVHGTYLFTANFCLQSNGYVQLEFLADGVRFGAFDAGDNVYHVCSTGTAVGKLQKGDKVWLYIPDAEPARNSENPEGFNYFAGFLINAMK